MRAKNFCLGLLAGGLGAYMAYRSLSPVQKQKLWDKIDSTCDDMKKKAVAYSFYANDVLDQTTQNLNLSGYSAKAQASIDKINRKIQALKSKKASSNDDPKMPKAEAHDDILLSSDDIFGASDESQALKMYPNGSEKKY